MKLLSHNGVLTADDNKTNIKLSFDVPDGVKSLRVEYKYNPKFVEDKEKSIDMIRAACEEYDEKIDDYEQYLPLANLVTLSFDDKNGYRGACHRHPNEQSIVISSNGSTPGIINAPVESGEWSVTLNVHFVGSDKVEYSIDIEGD